MFEHSDEHNFEKAAVLRNKIRELRRIFGRDRNVPTSINENNQILILPASTREKTVEIFLVRYGRLVHQELIGKKAPLNNLIKLLQKTYFNGKASPLFYTHEEIDELRIISSWLYRKHGSAKFIYINGKNEKEIIADLKSTVRNIAY